MPCTSAADQQHNNSNNTSRGRPPTKLNTNQFIYLFFCTGLQTDFEVPWDRAATQWVRRDWFGSHLFTAGKNKSSCCCLVKKEHCRLSNKPFINISLGINELFLLKCDLTGLSMCGMSFITLVAMGTAQTSIRYRWDMKPAFLYCGNTVWRCICFVCAQRTKCC